MDLVPITSTLWMLRLPVVNVYLARVDDGIAVVDTGPLGADDEILAAVRETGGERASVRQIVLTHLHKDHVGSAAALRVRTGAPVVAGAADAPIVSGDAPEPEAIITDEERPYYERVSPTIPAAPVVTVDRVVREGEDLGWSEPAEVLEVPGHTPGGIAIHLPQSRAVITGDTIASLGGRIILGPFNVDRATAITSFRRIATLDVDIACFGHGEPVIDGAAAALRAAAGLTLRLVYLFAVETVYITYDGAYFHRGANYLAQGHGFVDVGAFFYSAVWLPGAEHPPGYVVALAIPSLLGFTTYLQHQVVSALIGTGSIAVIACVGRRLAGPRTGIIAAAIAALYPGFWLYEAQLISETLAIFEVALVLLLALQFRARPTWARALAVGAVCGALALTRTEMILLVPLLLLPLAILTPEAPWKRRILWLTAAGAAAAIVIMPWVIYNLGRFDNQVLISSQGGRTLAASNCDPAYYGPRLGYKDLLDPRCVRAAEMTTYLAQVPADVRRPLDASWRDTELRRLARQYIDDHRRRLVLAVLPAREGRTWGLFRPSQQLRFDLIRGDIWFLWLQYFAYLVMLPFAIAGAIVLRRRRQVLWPLLAMIAMVVVTVAITFGSTRYRVPADVAIALLAAVAIDAVFRAWSRRGSEQPDEPDPRRRSRRRKREKLLPITR